MAVVRRYGSYLQVADTPDKKRRVRQLADALDVSEAEVIRRLIDRGIGAMEQEVQDAAQRAGSEAPLSSALPH